MFESRSRHGCLFSYFCVVPACMGRSLATGRAPSKKSYQLRKNGFETWYNEVTKFIRNLQSHEEIQLWHCWHFIYGINSVVDLGILRQYGGFAVSWLRGKQRIRLWHSVMVCLLMRLLMNRATYEEWSHDGRMSAIRNLWYPEHRRQAGTRWREDLVCSV